MISQEENNKCMVIFQPSGRRGFVASGTSIKEASIVLGVGIEGSCSEKAICGKCRVLIAKGAFEKYGIVSRLENLSPVSPAEREIFDPQEEKKGFRLACQAKILGDIVIKVPVESQLGKQIVRKAARDIRIKLNPAVKKYYVEMSGATLDDLVGDWERLWLELKKEYALKNLSIDYQVLLSLQQTVRQGEWKVTVSIWQGKEVIKVEPGRAETAYGLAVDIGTTTVAGFLCDLTSGKLIATASLMNPQVIYGEDVMSRISYTLSNPDGLKILRQAIIEGLDSLISDVCSAAGIRDEDILDMAIVGNTCMHHILLNIDPQYLGKAPFIPALHHSLDVKARDCGIRIAPGAYIHTLPIEAAFVGADNMAVLICEEPYNQDSMELIIDIGTNGELILGNRQRLLSSSCATGPALEGAEIKNGMRASPGAIEKILIDRDSREARFKVIGSEEWSDGKKDMGAIGICGSGIIDAVAQLFKAGIIDKTGRFLAGFQSPRFRVVNRIAEFVVAWAQETSTGQDIVISQKDIRAIQLAKAAMYAGAKIMMRKLGVEKVDKVILAGAFGSYIDKESAALLGLFPDCDMNNVYSIGNAAGDGARMALLDVNKRREADIISRKVEYIELTQVADFNRVFTDAMWIPHMKDKFPNFEHLLPRQESA